MTRPTILDRDDVAVVPVEPTEEMLDAGNERSIEDVEMTGTAYPSDIFDAMLSSSPHSSAWQEVREYVAASDARIAELEALVDRLRNEAQIHAMEARCANSTIAEIYQTISGSTGEPGNWNGAEPVRAYVSAATSRIAALELRLAEAERVIEQQTSALLPLSNAVFSDNGDMTISVPIINAEQCVSAYFAGRAARAWKEGK